MRWISRLTLFVAFLIFTSCAVSACSCVADPLGTRYRKASAVFIAQAVDFKGPEPEARLIQGEGQQTLQVIKSWKGIRKPFVSVNFDPPERTGTCPVLYYLEPGKKYLVFAYGSKLTLQSVCSDTWEVPSDKSRPLYEVMQMNIKKLKSFWFRLRARLRLA